MKSLFVLSVYILRSQFHFLFPLGRAGGSYKWGNLIDRIIDLIFITASEVGGPCQKRSSHKHFKNVRGHPTLYTQEQQWQSCVEYQNRTALIISDANSP